MRGGSKRGLHTSLALDLGSIRALDEVAGSQTRLICCILYYPYILIAIPLCAIGL